MPTFERLIVPVAVAALIGGALTGVLAAQTRAEDQSAITAAAAVVPQPSAASARDRTGGQDDLRQLFADGVAAYREGNIAGAIELWDRAAERGHLAAQWNLARLYLGDGEIKADQSRALKYLSLITRAHDPDAPRGARSAVTVEALIELALLNWSGVEAVGLKPSPHRAFTMFEHAAALFGNSRAQHYLGLMYLAGDGTKQNVGRGIRWLNLAASKQYAPAQGALGDYFWKRRATGDNAVRGLMWFALASENAKSGEIKAVFADRYNEALSEVDAAGRERVAALVSSWNARHVAAAE